MAEVSARRLVTLALSVAAFAAVLPAARSQVPSSAARAVLDQHCARCHDAAKLENPPAKGALGNILDIGDLARQRALVEPGDPDASRLYLTMLARHRPLDVFFGPVAGPSLKEIEAVRDWIASLKTADDTVCPGRSRLSSADVTRDAKSWRKAFAAKAPDKVRFLSLVPLYNACASDARLTGYRDAAAALVRALAKGAADVRLETVGEDSVLLAFRPAEIGLSLSEWDAIAGSDDGPGIVRADRLAAALVALPQVLDPVRVEASGATSAAHLVAGLAPITSLAAEYQRDVSLGRAAAELDTRAVALDARLAKVSGETASIAKRLRQGPVPRADWQMLRAALQGGAKPELKIEPARPETALRLSIWTDRTRYKAGDLLTINARASEACFLTIVAIESDGMATVLFPNHYDIDNKIEPGAPRVIPTADAPYQLRLDKKGRQGISAICNARAKRPEGMGHDFERQKFTSLGDWKAFLASSAEREATYQQTELEGRKFRARQEGRPEPPAEQLPVGTENEGRAGVAVKVD